MTYRMSTICTITNPFHNRHVFWALHITLVLRLSVFTKSSALVAYFVVFHGLSGAAV